jgi:hypothetical protein
MFSWWVSLECIAPGVELKVRHSVDAQHEGMVDKIADFRAGGGDGTLSRECSDTFSWFVHGWFLIGTEFRGRRLQGRGPGADENEDGGQWQGRRVQQRGHVDVLALEFCICLRMSKCTLC